VVRFVTTLLALLLVAACSADRPLESVSSHESELVVGGCQCVSSGTCSQLSYSDVPADGKYYVTTFGGGSDTQTMACGGTADGAWAYVADKARFGCGAKLLISAGGKQCVGQVADCGPNRCVEEAASGSCSSHFPILDVSPFITKYLLNLSGVGWSDKELVTATVIDSSSIPGCPGTPVGGSSGGGGSGGGGTGGFGGGFGGTSSGGSGGTPAACTAPSCVGCADCYAQCVCGVGDSLFCNQQCFGPSGGTGGGTPPPPQACTAPVCDGCADCFSQCVCDGMGEDTCSKICDAGQGTAGATGGVCEYPECGCGSCIDTCTCQGIDQDSCVNLCGKGDGPGPTQAGPSSGDNPAQKSCAASVVGARTSRDGSRAALALALALALSRVSRRRR
jgi:hypothetical protein